MWACPESWGSQLQRVDLQLGYFEHSWSVKMVVVGMNDQCIPYLVPRNFNTLHYWSTWCPSEVLTHKALCLSSARIWSLGFSPNLSERTQKIKVRWDAEIWGLSVKTNELFRRTCQGNLCPRQLKCRARDFPSQRVCFHCGETKTYCIIQTPTHRLCTNRGHKQAAVIWKIICFRFCWIQSLKLWWGMNPRFTDGSVTWPSLYAQHVHNTWEDKATETCTIASLWAHNRLINWFFRLWERSLHNLHWEM